MRRRRGAWRWPTPVDSLASVKRKLEAIISLSSVPEDPIHSRSVLKWILRLKPDAGEALKIAALGHDVERAIESRKVKRENYDDYDEFKAAHASNSARILKEIMRECGVDDAQLIEQVYQLVCRHEVGGDPESDLLKDADAISFFEVNLPLYYERNTREETKRRCEWGYRRLSGKTRGLVARLRYEDEELNRLLQAAIRASL